MSVADLDDDRVVESNCVIQKSWTLSDPIRIPKQWDYDSDEPLLRVTIKRFNKVGATSIGISGAHVLGP